jgi:uncharacterized protein (DUF2141 family)
METTASPFGRRAARVAERARTAIRRAWRNGVAPGALGAAVLTGCATTPPEAPDGDEVALRVRVTGVEPGLGFVRCAVYVERATFLAPQGAAEAQQQAADTACAVFEFRVPAARAIVVSAHQDVDANGELDRGAFGLPSEPWGFSGTPSLFGPPSWDACAIVPPTNGAPIEIPLRGSARPRGGRPTP